MSPNVFEEFYWPGMKAVMQAVIDCGGVPKMFLEGNYPKKVEHFLEFEKGTIALNLIGTDMKVAKKILGGHVCMSGGVDGTLLQYGTPEQVERNVKEMLDIMAPSGGYILDCSISLDVAKPENLDMLFKTAKEYGKY